MATTSSSVSENQPFPALARALDGSARAVWHKSAPRAVRRACAAGKTDEAWARWSDYLARRKKPVLPAELLFSKEDPLHWALCDAIGAPPAPNWLTRTERLVQKRRSADPSLETELFAWLAASPPQGDPAGHGVQRLACAYALPGLASALSPPAWWALLEHLLQIQADAGAISLSEDPLGHQLLRGELPLTLAYLLPEIRPCRKLKATARRALASGLLEVLDGEGLPHGKHLPLLRPLLACWTRCQALAGELKGGRFSGRASEQYHRLVRQALRLARPDGSHVLCNGSAIGATPDLFSAALKLDGNSQNRRIAALVLPCSKDAKRPSKPRRRRSLPHPAVHSEWAATAVLRPQWSRSGARLTVLYPGQQLCMELSCGKDVVWSGQWELEVRCGGEAAAPTSDWKQLCWVSDKDVDYLELEIELSRSIRVHRQIALARQDHLLLLADAVLGDEMQPPGPGPIEYRGCLPLGPGVAFQGAGETREGFLVGGKRRATVLPLALPEWRADRRAGELIHTRRGLELRQSSPLPRLYAPLLVDLDRQRAKAPLTWRQLTVAQSLARVPHDVAVGFRAAIGKKQWLLYRCLAEKANRTVLGHNLSTEMLLARFDRSGEVEPLIEIE